MAKKQEEMLVMAHLWHESGGFDWDEENDKLVPRPDTWHLYVFHPGRLICAYFDGFTSKQGAIDALSPYSVRFVERAMIDVVATPMGRDSIEVWLPASGKKLEDFFGEQIALEKPEPVVECSQVTLFD